MTPRPAGADGRLCPLPRSQVRPDSDARITIRSTGIFASSREPTELPHVGEPERTPEYPRLREEDAALKDDVKAYEERPGRAEGEQSQIPRRTAGPGKRRSPLSRPVHPSLRPGHGAGGCRQTRTPRVLVRRQPRQPGPQVPRQFLEVLAGPTAAVQKGQRPARTGPGHRQQGQSADRPACWSIGVWQHTSARAWSPRPAISACAAIRPAIRNCSTTWPGASWKTAGPSRNCIGSSCCRTSIKPPATIMPRRRRRSGESSAGSAASSPPAGVGGAATGRCCCGVRQARSENGRTRLWTSRSHRSPAGARSTASSTARICRTSFAPSTLPAPIPRPLSAIRRRCRSRRCSCSIARFRILSGAQTGYILSERIESLRMFNH